MVNRCVNCGGLLHYDIGEAKLKCESCDSLFEVDSYGEKTEAKENQDAENMDMNIYTCPNCGAKISSTDGEAVEYCLYCGSFVTLSSSLEQVKRPDYIMPFSKTIEDCKTKYKHMIGRKIYAPKEFRDEEFLNGFKGIYIPYWTYDYDYGPRVSFKSKREYRKGDYIHTEEYNVSCRTDGSIKGVCFDASSSLDDSISSRIVPFDTDKLKDFNSAYMFGFFGDTADTESSVYLEDADEIAHDEIWKEVVGQAQISDGVPQKPEEESFDENFGIKKTSHLAMLPLWFLTWRKNDRVAYSVMNGESGEMYSEVPVDIKRYLVISLITAIPIFLLLNMFITFSAGKMLTLSVVLSFFMLILYTSELDKIVKRTIHAEDKGYLARHREAAYAAEQYSENIFSKVGEILKDIFTGGIWMIFIVLGVGYMLIDILPIAAIVVGIASPIYLLFRIGRNGKLLGDGTVWLDIIGVLAALLIAGGTLILDPAKDIYYYVTALVCMGAVGFTAICAMRRYNELVTRPVPHFFDREAGGEQ